MPWDHMLVIIVSDLGNFQESLPIVLIRDLASRFYKKYFQHEERVTTAQLINMHQKHGEDLVDFMHRFRDLALDCYDEKDEEALVEICISNIVAYYRVYLENIDINQFSQLLEAVKKTSILVKLNGLEAWKSEEEERHLGASFGQQDYQETTVVTSHKSRKSLSN
ncbi:unnamed protein product [Prunus armeniaca]